MDENVPGPSCSSPDSSLQPSSSNGWSSPSLSSVPPPPEPFNQGHESQAAVYSPLEANSFEVDVDADDEDDLDALLFGSAAFQSSSINGKDDDEDLDRFLLESSSLLSLTSEKDEEISMAFQDAVAKDKFASSSAMFKCITEPQIPVDRKNDQNGSGSHHHHVFTVTSPSSSSSNGEHSKTEAFPNSKSKPASNKKFSNHQQHNPYPEGDDDDHTSSSFQNSLSLTTNKTDEEIVIPSSNSQSDSGGISEEDARISSEPLCSVAGQIPEHTLSDISGPSSSLVDKVPANFIDDGVAIESVPGEVAAIAKGIDIDADETFEIKASASSSMPVSHLTAVKRMKKTAEYLEGSTTTTSSSSLSESDEGDYIQVGHHRVLNLLPRSGSLSFKDHNTLLQFPPPPPQLLEEIGETIVPMTVDTCEDYWTRLHDIRINGCILEYAGIGKTLHDNGFAQSNVPLTPLNHYFEITILDPGEFCYISIGLARKDYNVHKNPGWCRGSIAYHADDGKIFIGGGVGTPFGPRCTIDDILGCGVIFPSKYGELREGSSWPWEMSDKKGEGETNDKHTVTIDDTSAKAKSARSRLLSVRQKKKTRVSSIDNFGDRSSESEDDIWWTNKNQVCEDKVKVFFLRNRKLLGMKEVRIPKGGFYPTIGMMSTNERVSVDLHPLTG